jgi:general secretion pathway protein G
MKMKKNKRNIIYFTLMEMVVVIAIIALLATIVTPMYFKHVKKARVNTAKTQVVLLEQAVMDYQLDTGKTPNSLQDLSSNVSSLDKWDGPYLKSKVPKDPWGNEYIFISPGTHGDFDIICYGANGQPGGTGTDADIGNWVE